MPESENKRTFLFLQGPHGSLFAQLASALAMQGYAIRRINLNGGDRADWIGVSTDYRSSLKGWPLFFDDFVVDHGVTDVILFGDCRPHHASAHGMAKLRGIRVHVFEEGYIRPDFMTLQEDGVNGNSTLPRDGDWYRDQAESLPALAPVEPVPSNFMRRLRETSRYTVISALTRPLYPFYRSHRSATMLSEALGWAIHFATKRREHVRSAATMAAIGDTPYFALPLQLNSDYQIRVHSPFRDMRAALRFIIKSFARAAPPGVNLIVKRHPLDGGLASWRRFVRREAQRYGVAERVFYISDGDISDLVANARAVVTVNSTVGTLALNSGVPVAVLGEAIYDIEGIVRRVPLDRFWTDPRPVDTDLYEAFKRVLIDRCLIPGGYLSEEGIAMLVTHAERRLTSGSSAGHATLPARDGAIPLESDDRGEYHMC
jgi:capsular polysaccharide export protein